MEHTINVSDVGDEEVADDLQEGGEVAIPAVIRDLVREIEKTYAGDSSVGEEAVVEKQGLGEVDLVESEDGEEDETGHDHGDNVVFFSAVVGGCRKSEWEQKDHQSACE